jgi:hypothetical protein
MAGESNGQQTEVSMTASVIDFIRTGEQFRAGRRIPVYGMPPVGPKHYSPDVVAEAFRQNDEAYRLAAEAHARMFEDIRSWRG